jgi:uncharacterized protein YciI
MLRCRGGNLARRQRVGTGRCTARIAAKDAPESATDARQELVKKGHPGGPIYFACFTRRGNTSLADIEGAFLAHKQWVADQEAAGRIVVAGPFLADDLSWDGDGLIVFRVNSSEQAERLARADPMHALGLRTFEIQAWQLNEGYFGIALTFSKGGFEFT